MTTSSPKERDSGRSRGFAFVRFFDKHDAEVRRENWEKWKNITNCREQRFTFVQIYSNLNSSIQSIPFHTCTSPVTERENN